jgi:hypothetical protein
MSNVIKLSTAIPVVRAEHWHLIDTETGRRVYVGDKFFTRDGDEVILRGGTPPHKPSSTGRVHCYEPARDLDHYWFPSVLDLTWVEVEDDV